MAMAVLDDAGAALALSPSEQALCIRQSRPGSLEARRRRSGAGTLLVNVRHPLYRRCEALGVESAPFLKVALERWMREA